MERGEKSERFEAKMEMIQRGRRNKGEEKRKHRRREKEENIWRSKKKRGHRLRRE